MSNFEFIIFDERTDEQKQDTFDDKFLFEIIDLYFTNMNRIQREIKDSDVFRAFSKSAALSVVVTTIAHGYPPDLRLTALDMIYAQCRLTIMQQTE